MIKVIEKPGWKISKTCQYLRFERFPNVNKPSQKLKNNCKIIKIKYKGLGTLLIDKLFSNIIIKIALWCSYNDVNWHKSWSALTLNFNNIIFNISYMIRIPLCQHMRSLEICTNNLIDNILLLCCGKLTSNWVSFNI